MSFSCIIQLTPGGLKGKKKLKLIATSLKDFLRHASYLVLKGDPDNNFIK
jgi:hypothetical protein